MDEVKLSGKSNVVDIYDRLMQAVSEKDLEEASDLNHLLYEIYFSDYHEFIKVRQRYGREKKFIAGKIGEEKYNSLVSEIESMIGEYSKGLDRLLMIGQMIANIQNKSQEEN